MDVGTATGTPGELTTGDLRVTDLPTGGEETVPVLVADGEAEGPTLWVTASVHSDETTGMAVAQDVMTAGLASELRGTVVCVPVLNPAGLRTGSRTSYYHDEDPNRLFGLDDGTVPPTVQELINRRVYERIVDTADLVLSLHTSWVATFPYTISPRVTYGRERTEAEAEAVAEDLERLATAFGFPVVRQFERADVLDRGLDRSLTGALAVEEGIPAITPELGGRLVVEEDVRAAAVEGVENVLREFGMLEAPARPVEGAPTPPVDYPVRRAVHPRAETPGVVRYRVEEGDVVAEGDPIADVVTPHGTHRETVRTDRAGYVLSQHEGNVAYENDAVADLAVRDEGSLVVEYDPR